MMAHHLSLGSRHFTIGSYASDLASRVLFPRCRRPCGASLAVLRIGRPSDGFDQNGVFVQDGEQVNRGVELSVHGGPLPGLRLITTGHPPMAAASP
ncbi:MAG: fcuA, partial [Pseudomonas sp.]|nr:fcuA [Pseudomonas sp.]